MAPKAQSVQTRHVEAPPPAPSPDRELANVATLATIALQSEREPEFMQVRDQLVANADRMKAADIASMDGDTLESYIQKCGQLYSRASASGKEIEKERKRLKDPLVKAGKALDARYGEFLDPIEGVKRAADERVRQARAEIARRAAEEARAAAETAGEDRVVEGAIVEPPAPIRTADGTLSYRKVATVEIENLSLVAVARPDLVELKTSAALAELQAGVAIPGLKLGTKEVPVSR